MDHTAAHTSLDLRDLRIQNFNRASRWHPGFPHDSAWGGGDWGNAMAGETGEACNIVKKIRRLECGLQGRESEQDIDVLIGKLSSELADVVIYADLLAVKYGVDLALAVKVKFNKVSVEQNFPEWLS